MNRVLSSARVQLLNWQYSLGWPLAVLASAFVINLVIFTAIRGSTDDPNPTTGGLASIYFTAIVVGSQSVATIFPFALGMGLTRRMFYAGNALVILTQALVFGAVVYLGSLIEDWTGGWGLNLSFFGIPAFDVGNPVLQFLVYTTPFVLLGYLGVFIAVVHQRWGMNGIFTASIVTAALAGLATVLLTSQDAWNDLGSWFADEPVGGLLGGWPLALGAVLAVAGFLAIRRATP